MEPWDGPASIAFTDGTLIGAVLDRNGLRPSRYCDHHRRPRDHGVGSRRARHSRRARSCARIGCGPARCCSSTPAQGRIISDDEIKRDARRRAPVRRVAAAAPRRHRGSARAPAPSGPITRPCCAGSRPSATRRRTCGCSSTPMALGGEEPIGSMGTDTALAVLSDRPRLLYDYFTQLFAQVTNPPLDAIREELVTSMASTHRPRRATCSRPDPKSCRQIKIEYAGPPQRSGREAPPPAAGIAVPLDDAAAALRPGRGRPRARARDGGAVPQGQPRGGRRLRHPDPLGPRRRCARTRRSRACSRPPACTITSFAKARAPAAACWSRPATRARCTTSRCSWATAPAR